MENISVPRLRAVRGEALSFLKDHTTAVVATSKDDMPFASTVYYVVDDDFNFYFVTPINTNKYLNISKSAKVAIVVGTGPEHISVTAQGRGDYVTGREETAVFERLHMIMFHEHAKKWPARDMAKFKDIRMVVFRVVPEMLLFMNLDDENYSGSISDRYVTIIP